MPPRQAKNLPATSQAAPKQSSFKGFANYTLTDREKEEQSVWAEDYGLDRANEALETFVENGYKVTLSKDAANASYIVSLTCVDPQSPNSGLCLTTRGRDIVHALSLAEFKHVNVLKEDWSKHTEKQSPQYG